MAATCDMALSWPYRFEKSKSYGESRTYGIVLAHQSLRKSRYVLYNLMATAGYMVDVRVDVSAQEMWDIDRSQTLESIGLQTEKVAQRRRVQQGLIMVCGGGEGCQLSPR